MDETNLEKIITGLKTIATYDKNATLAVGADSILVGSDKSKDMDMSRSHLTTMRNSGFAWDFKYACWHKSL